MAVTGPPGLAGGRVGRRAQVRADPHRRTSSVSAAAPLRRRGVPGTANVIPALSLPCWVLSWSSQEAGGGSHIGCTAASRRIIRTTARGLSHLWGSKTEHRLRPAGSPAAVVPEADSIAGAHSPGRGHRPDADRRATAPSPSPGPVRRARQRASTAPGPEPAPARRCRDNPGRQRRSRDTGDPLSKGPWRADQRVRAGA
jgi:hypothetical protein